LRALPLRFAEPEVTAGAAPGGIDITTLAGEAIDRAGTPITPTTTTPRTTQAEGIEPIRHKIERGETAYTIARLYNVSVRSLSDWNGLGSDLAVREGQYLLIPLASDVATATPPTGAIAGVAPGVGSPTPTPPSAKVALPDETITAAEKPKSPDLGSQQTAASESKLLMPVSGQIIRAYAKKKNDGIDIAAPAGTPVKAAEAGTVAAVTVDTDGITIVVIRHKDGLLTVYANIEAVSVKKGASVTRGQSIAKVRAGDPAFMHFEVRQGLESIDPAGYI
jgi:murein DD-endopeptidase MepM/ murein hydrolase activator NlpD